MSDKNWIQKAIKKPGSLTKSLGVKKGLDNNKNITFTDKIAEAKKA